MAWFSVEAVNDESIHNHAAFARIDSTQLQLPHRDEPAVLANRRGLWCLKTITIQSGRPPLHVIVTCANRKSLPIPSHLQLGEVPGTSAIERARTWIARLADTGSTPQVPASDLYAGEHWSVARRVRGASPAR